MDLSGLTAVTTPAEMIAWLAANCLTPIRPVMTGSDFGTIMQKIVSLSGGDFIPYSGATGDVDLGANKLTLYGANAGFSYNSGPNTGGAIGFSASRFGIFTNGQFHIDGADGGSISFDYADNASGWTIGRGGQNIYLRNAADTHTWEYSFDNNTGNWYLWNGVNGDGALSYKTLDERDLPGLSLASAGNTLQGEAAFAGAAAQTVFTVTLGTALADNAFSVSITPANYLTSTSAYYISAKTVNGFEITFNTALTGDVAFDWILKRS
ncbi:hypothetical protein KXD93_22500 [Mucilaginibacter sp. BJC16-A38]|uniref:hypothetical protein n=1 Tax=Mucilaginibacter phenanthrenivorans TaxID=1234842 RepID=UPI0021579B7E|nr:hypothetical protein [Mucilaginibacter phenanthrenivorans]MCR8560442.1 hypothetical protein [Mucilaginibacter phenanthrenivorans]